MAVTTIDQNGVHVRKLMPLFKEDTDTWETRADMLERGGPYVCWYCKKVATGASMEEVRAPSTPCKKCARCHEAQYCSMDCQRAHWKKGHKRTCGLKDPCPICGQRSAKDGPNNFMCFVCGFRCCGDCSDLKRFRLMDGQPLAYFSHNGDKPVCPGCGQDQAEMRRTEHRHGERLLKLLRDKPEGPHVMMADWWIGHYYQTGKGGLARDQDEAQRYLMRHMVAKTDGPLGNNT